jgi:hypothetical protein
MGKKSRSGSGLNILDHLSESLETIFRVEILKFFDANLDLGSGIFLIWIREGKIRIRDKHPGFVTLENKRKFSQIIDDLTVLQDAYFKE